MNAALYLLVALLAAAVVYLVGRTAVRTYLKYRGTRVITCPETGRAAAVEVDAATAAEKALLGGHDVHLRSCSRWPERQDCGQECLTQIESSPSDCLLKNILGNWYAGKSCALCGKEFGEIQWHDHKPCLMEAGGVTLEWKEFKPEAVAEALSTHQPVCWDCHIAEKFRRQHPDLAVDREWKSESARRH